MSRAPIKRSCRVPSLMLDRQIQQSHPASQAIAGLTNPVAADISSFSLFTPAHYTLPKPPVDL